MARTKSLQEQADSQEAICDYMYYKAENEYMHSARVLVTSFGEIKYSNILTIIPNIGTNDARVYIEGDSKFERNYYLEFSFCKGTLSIRAQDRCGNSIEIDIQ